MEKAKKIIYDEFTDIAYSVDERQKFDLFVPKTAGKKMPILFFVHGGGWKSGNKTDYLKDMKRICEKYPVCCVSAGYRFINEDMTLTYEDIQSDIANAVHTALKYVENLGIEVTKRAIGGISAGAYNSLLFAFQKNEISPGYFSFVLDKSGPCDLSDRECYKGMEELSRDMAFRIYGQLMGFKLDEKSLSSPDIIQKLKNASPYYYATKNSPALIIAHSSKDQVVPLSCAEKLYKKFLSLGIEAEFVDMNGCGHSETIDSVEEKINKTLDKYIEKYLLS
ncbi:MAG: alpha/beta hydrolase [Clostridia bacterium]|nr:alpha/beta hydrolase [Clostridia bacterium]